MGNAVQAATNPFGCCLVQHSKLQEVDFLRTAPNKVELAASVLGGFPGFSAYHTSVVINGEEFFFCPMGVMRNMGIESHRRVGPDGVPIAPMQNDSDKQAPKIIDMGMTARSPDMLHQFLTPHFMPGTYDLLHKNCNTFTDVALWFLLGYRLESTYNSIEKVGKNNPRLLEQVTGGAYVANPRALEFNLDEVLQSVGEAGDDGEMLPGGYPRFVLGTVVRVHGLQNELARHLNGKAGIVQRYNSKNCRYEVRVANELKGLRPENLEPIQTEQEMMIAGLKSDLAKHLNGEHCAVLKFNGQSERIEVKITSTGEVKALKIENVQPLSVRDSSM